MSNENKTQPETKSEAALPTPKPEPQPLAETMAHVIRAGGTELETNASNESKRQPSSDAKSSEPNRALILPAKSSHPLPSSQDAKSTALLLEGLPELPTLLPEERYQLEGEFAKGGLGRIIKAHDERLNRPVAMKEMLRRTGGNAEKRFLREALITAKLEHPGIIPVHDLGRWNAGGAFYTMKLVSGKSFDKIIAEKKSFEERLALLPHVIDACDAMAYAHEKGVIHRDLKPGNILLGSFGETVVIDWGIAKDLGNNPEDLRDEDSLKIPDLTSGIQGEAYREHDELLEEQLTKEGSILGTPAYMPLEQAKGMSVDARADVYALGAILYHVMCGKPPYSAKKNIEVLRKLFDGPPQEITEREPSTPKEIAAIIHKAMARDAEERYPTAKELVADLKLYQTGKLVGAHSYSASELFWRWLKKNQVYLGAAALAVLVAAAASTWSYVEIREEQKRTQQALKRETEAKQREESEKNSANLLRRKAEVEGEENKIKLAKSSLETDPLMTLAYLKALKPEIKEPNWGEVRTIAQDAIARGVPVVLGADWNGSGEPHKDQIYSVAFSPDGSLLASTSKDKTIKIWDIATRKLRATLVGHESNVMMGKFSSNGKFFVSAEFTAPTIRVWDASTWKELAALDTLPSNALSLDISPGSNKLAASFRDGSVFVWDLSEKIDKKHIEFKPHLFMAFSALFSSDNNIYTSGYDGGVFYIDIGSNKVTKVFQESNFIIFKTSISNDYKKIVFSGYRASDKYIKTFIYQNNHLSQLPSESFSMPTALVFSLNSKFIALGTDSSEIFLWDLDLCEKSCIPSKILEDGPPVINLSFSLNDEFITVNRIKSEIEIWNVISKKQVATLRNHKDIVSSMTIFGTTLASAGRDNQIRLWDLSKIMGLKIEKYNNIAEDISFSPKKDIVAATGDNHISIFDYINLKNITTINRNRQLRYAKFSADGSFLVSSESFGDVVIWDTESWAEVFSIPALDFDKVEIAISKDSSKLALLKIAVSPVVELYDLKSKKRLWSISDEAFENLQGIDFSPDSSSVAVTSFRQKVFVLNAANGESIVVHPVVGCQSTTQHQDLLVASGCSGAPQLWHQTKGSTALSSPQRLLGHTEPVSIARFSSDGRFLGTAGKDNSAGIWDVDSWSVRFVPGQAGDVEGIDFSHDSRMLGVVSGPLAILYNNALVPQKNVHTWLLQQQTPPL